MDLIEIKINDLQADYVESESLPVSLEIKTDEFFKLGTTAGTRIDNPARQLIFPGTIQNQRIFESLSGLASASIRINGSPIFTGKALPKYAKRNKDNPGGYSTKLLGGARDLFSELGGKTLRGLNIGSVPFTKQYIQDSWTNDFSSGYPVVFAPVFYGATTGAGTNDFAPADLRPHVYFPAILEALWDLLEVRVESVLFESPDFKKFLFLFGVGDNWEVGGADADEFETFSFNSALDQLVGVGGLNLPLTATLDPGGIWTGSEATLIPGDWTFSGYAPIVGNGYIKFEISGLYSQVLVEGAPFSFGPITIQSGTTASLRLYPDNPANNTTTIPGGRLNGSLADAPAFGGDISVASCLPGDKITDFLSGLSHLFNLVWHFDPVSRVLTVDPRFDWKIGGINYPGFYTRAGFTGTTEDWTGKFDASSFTQSPPERPFGDFVDLNNKPEESEQYKRARAQATSSGASFLGARYTFDETGKAGQSDTNPYFENLLQFGYGAPLNLAWMPRVAPDPEGGVNIEDVPPTFETSGPKYAYFFGAFNGWSSWSFDGSYPGVYPIIFQKPKDGVFPVPNLSASYSDYIGTGATNRLPGLASIFYPQYLATLNRGQVLEGDVFLKFSDVQPRAELFRRLKRIVLGQTFKNWIFLGVKNFQPLKVEPSQSVFVQPVEVTAEDTARLVSSAQKYWLDD